MPKKISERSRNHGRAHKDCYLQALIHRQTYELPKIIYELQTFRSKKTHWAWWVFPTNHCGKSEPPPATKVSSPAAAKALLVLFVIGMTKKNKMFWNADSFNQPLHAPWYHEESESE